MNTLLTVEIILAILFILTIVIQDKSSGMSLTFGGDGNSTYYGSKQGLDKFLNTASHVLAALFIINSLILAFQS